MAELERLANHFGDIGAICNDASFSLMHAQCGILRERTLRAADACFGHRLMMDVIVPGGVARDLAPDGTAQVRRCLPKIAQRFPAPGRALRQHRLAAGSHRHHRHREARIGAPVRRRRLCRPRIGPRLRCAPQCPAMRPMMSSTFEVPVLDAGDVNARVWIRIREVEQSLSLIEQILGRLPDGPIRHGRRPASELCEGLASSKPSAATCWCGCGSTARPRGALPSARCVLVPMAAAGSRDRGQHRRRLPALQQIVQLLLFGHDL